MRVAKAGEVGKNRRRMPRAEEHGWRVPDVVAVEAACMRVDSEGLEGGGVDAAFRERLRKESAGLSPVEARRRGLRMWLAEVGDGGVARRFEQARSLVAAVVGFWAFFSGVGVVVGIERAGGGSVHVVWFLALALGVPWLVTLAGLFGRIWAGRKGVLGLLGRGVSWLLRKWSGAGDWWDGSGEMRRVVGATVMRVVYGSGLLFQIGTLAGLIGLVLFRHVEFYWESTTEHAMGDALAWMVRSLGAPWASWWPGAVPGAEWIEKTRRIPGVSLPADTGPWWQFLMMALLVWGVVPRLLLWGIGHWYERRLLRSIELQSMACRRVWRELTAVRRGEVVEGPADGVLVLDFGGTNPDRDALRPFFLRRLRVNPVAWEALGVLEKAAEERARQALAAAPAGVVLLGEAWDLSVPALKSAVKSIRAAAGPEARVIVVIGNVDEHGAMRPPKPGERVQWERAVDALGDPALEIAAYEEMES